MARRGSGGIRYASVVAVRDGGGSSCSSATLLLVGFRRDAGGMFVCLG